MVPARGDIEIGFAEGGLYVHIRLAKMVQVDTRARAGDRSVSVVQGPDIAAGNSRANGFDRRKTVAR